MDIKTVALLPNVLAKQAAREQGAREAWMVDAGGRITEGASSNAWIVSRDGKLVTRPLGNDILPGITRAVVVELARELGVPLVEQPVSLRDLPAVEELFVCGTTTDVQPIVELDGRPIGNGKPGPITNRLREALAVRLYEGKA